MTYQFRVLFCDYDGEFEYADTLSKIGYIVDQIRPDALRQISVGEHQVYIFMFQAEEHMKKAMRTCEKLKAAELTTPIFLLNRAPATPTFLNHKTATGAADAYVANPSSENVVLDALETLVGCPVPISLKGNIQLLQEEKDRLEEIEEYRKRMTELEKKIEDLQGDRSKTEEALEAQRNFYKPKLKALLEEQKIQVQSETEQLKFELSEVEAKLLDREMKIKKLEEAIKSQEKAQNTLREFYQSKLKSLESEKKSKAS
ncbi:MAG: hypothetical protein J0L93_01675 [Deltaproteobacteria bacterium]|nr:hypothetical protein [Deltaproteobacteria bacterium]